MSQLIDSLTFIHCKAVIMFLVFFRKIIAEYSVC